MLSRLWKGIFNEPDKCSAEMKLGLQVYRGVKCVLPKNHAGHHQANALTSWPNRPPSWPLPQPKSGPTGEDL